MTRSWEPQFPRCFRRRAPPYPPRPSASPPQVTPILGPPRPPSSGPPSQATWRNAVARPGQEPHQAGTGFPQNKSGLHTPCPVPGSLAEATGCPRTSRSGSGTRARPADLPTCRPADRPEQGRPSIRAHRTPPRAEFLPRTVAHGAALALTAPQRAGPAGGRL